MNNTQQALSPEEIANNYLAAWNETDAFKRQELLSQVWTPDGTYQDPLMQGQGIAHISQLIEAAQQQFAGLRFTPAGQAEQVGHYLRFSWHLVPAAEESQPIAGGTDFCTLNESSVLRSVIGFIDFAPTPAS